MKSHLLLSTMVCFSLLGFSQTKQTEQKNLTVKQQRKQLQHQLAKYEKSLKKLHAQKDGIPPNAYNEQDFKNTMNPVTGEPEFYKLVAIKGDLDAGKYQPTKPLSLLANVDGNQKGVIGEPWTERGPYNVGGRTRAIMFDPNDPTGKRVFAGGVSGGLWVNNDVSNNASEWTPLSGMWSNTSVTCMAYDPNDTNTFYVGTGEAETGDAAGSGIWKSTDGGVTWTNIFVFSGSPYTSTIKNGNFYITDIKVRNNNGVSEIYAGVSGANIRIYFNDGWLGLYQAGLYKSTDGGATFTKSTSMVVPESSTIGLSIQQIEIAADNAVWVSTRTSRFGSSASSGGKIYRSTDGENFSKIYDANDANSRVKFGLSKTNPLKAYALLSTSVVTEPVRIIKTTDGGTSWSATNDATPVITLPKDADTGIPNNDFTRGQAFYDLVIVPDPENDEIVYTGGIDLFKSTNGAGTWTQISKWSNNNNLAGLSVSMVHADQHAIVFNPKNPGQILFGNDGGIFFAANKNSLNTTSSIPMRNTRYNVTQYYGATLNPAKTPSNEEFLAGAQDNGTSLFAGAPLTNNFYSESSYYGGDGCNTEYGPTGNYKIYSYVYNYHYITAPNGSNYSLINTGQGTTGLFVNVLAVDRNRNVFFSSRGGYSLNRVLGLNTNNAYTRSTISAGSAGSDGISKLTVSPFTTASTTLFAGTNLGKLIKITNADTTPVNNTITTPFAGTVSDIKFGANEDEILVTVSNYGATMVNVWYTNDGGASWKNKEGNLPDMPVRAIFMNPDQPKEVIIGTEMGIWGTSDFDSTNPTWAQFSGAIGNTRITQLDYRPATRTLLAATYGRGAWTSTNTQSSMATSDQATSKQDFKVYPNPSRGSVFVKFESAKIKKVDVSLYDASGKIVFSKKNVASNEEMITNLQKGFYILKANNGAEMVYTTPIIIR